VHRHFLAAGIAVAALLPTVVLAQQTCDQRSENRVVGTLAGAGVGALLGGAIAGHDDRTAGVVIGGVGGAVAGNQIAGRGDCTRTAGYRDDNNRWHAADVRPASGHYDSDGRWDPRPSIGRYDANGRWLQGQAAGHRDSTGAWVADAQPGYYRDGRWQRGQAYGYYDSRGGWVGTATASYGHGSGLSDWNGAGEGFDARRSWLEAGIHRGMQSGSLAQQDGWHALRQLQALTREEHGLRHFSGRLGREDAQRMQAKLDEVASNLRWSRMDETRRF
jgi:hypothetical protein